MDTETYNLISLLVLSATAVGAIVFGGWQIKINQRLKKLQDYVAVSIIPKKDSRLQIMNVGRVNLYLHRWEVGNRSENFYESILIPAGAKPALLVSVDPNVGEKPVRLYLTDESGKKYLSTGKVVIEPVSVRPLSQMQPQSQQQSPGTPTPQVAPIHPTPVQILTRMGALSYKTKRYNWEL